MTRRTQVDRMREVATQALTAYPIDVTGLRLVAHAFYTTFRVDAAGGQRYALRINVQSRREPSWIAAEMAWQVALADETDLWVPTPQRTRDGELTTRVWCEPVGETLNAVLYSWLPGSNLGDRVTRRHMREVGRALATLHTHAETWAMPAGCDLPLFDEPLYGWANNLTGDARSELVTDAQRDVFARALTEIGRHYAAMFDGVTPTPIHADVHQWNMKWFDDRLSLFDFDDSGYGVPLQDLATTAYYVRDNGRGLEAALHEGYASLRPLPAEAGGDRYEALIAARNVLLLNDVLVTINADIREMLATYLPRSAARVRHWLDTGTYSFDVTE
jgi:Ser/Thr protein kinase RdoA (MazF antagonist)